MRARWSGDEGLEPTEVLDAGPEGFGSEELERQIGFVADLDLLNGTELCGVIVAVSATVLIVEGWDTKTRATNGELSKVAIDSIRRISIP